MKKVCCIAVVCWLVVLLENACYRANGVQVNLHSSRYRYPIVLHNPQPRRSTCYAGRVRNSAKSLEEGHVPSGRLMIRSQFK